MKTRSSFTFLLLIAHLSFLNSQIPQGFTYQAIAKDAGNPIANQSLPVRISIMADSLGTLVIWQELHSTVTTNASGLFTLILGKGSRQAPSTVAAFSDIDWSVTPKFIKTEISYSGWKTMGVTRFWSVPYSLNTANVTGTLSKLAVKGKTAINDEALFEVRNKDGQTIFAVYNEGVRVYVSDGQKGLKGGFAVGGFGTDKAVSTPYFVVGKDSVRVYLDTNPLTKKLKGGFAVGGYDLTKGIVVQDYLDVNSDSVRIYIDSNPATKKLKGGFAVGGFDMVKGTSTNYMNVNPDSTSIIYPSQNRIYWYPLKNAFLTGKVLIEKPDSVGTNSFASGYESKAKGKWSQALGYKAIARGDFSTAIGKNAVANKINSFAFGQWANAKNEESYAFGRGAIAEGFRSYAFGSAGVDSTGAVTGVAFAKGDYSFAIGQGSQALGKGAFTLGLADTARGDYSTAIGYLNRASGKYSTAMGIATTASGWNSTATGQGTIASGGNSITIGCQTTASGWNSTAMGYLTTASGVLSTAIGLQTIASGDYSTAMGGFYTTASGDYSTAMGYQTTASGHFSTSMGLQSNASGWNSSAMGYQATSSGGNSTAMGYYTKANTFSMVTFGRYNDTTKYHGGNSYTTWFDDDPLFVIGNGASDNARHNAVTVLKNGNFGIGSSNPTAKLEVNLANSSGWSGNLKALRVYAPDNGYYLDVNTSIISAGNTGYHFNPNGNTGLTISTNGNVGIGTTNPSQKLHVNGDIRLEGGGIQNLSGGVGIGFTSTGWYSDVGNLAARIPSTTGDLYVQTPGGASTYLRVGPGIGGMELFVGKAVFDNAVGIATSSIGTYKLYVNGNAYCTGTWGGSDSRWKKDILTLSNLMSEIKQLTPVSFTWRRDEYPDINFDDGRQIGLIAQEVEKIFPELVKTDDNGYKAVSYEKLSVILLAGIKEQQQQIEAQNQQIDQLSDFIIEMKSEIASLRSQ